MTCSVPDCDRPLIARGWCSLHYERWRRNGDLLNHRKSSASTAEDRFWSKVDKTDSCWLWTGSTNNKGYGWLHLSGRTTLAHRFAYELLKDPIPAGMTIDHRCFRKNCVNPEHLRLASWKQQQENQGPQRNNKSGIRNVVWHQNKWVVWVTHNGKRHCGGRFFPDQLAEAEMAAINLRNQLFTHNDADRGQHVS